MASFHEFYLPSADNEGHVIRIGYYKPQGRPGVVSASEGASSEHDSGAVFTHRLFQDRTWRQEVAGRSTKKAIARSLIELLTTLKGAGVLSADSADQYIAEAQKA